MKRLMQSILLGCALFLALGVTTAMAQSPSPVGGGQMWIDVCNAHLEDAQPGLNEALASLALYSTGFTWTTSPIPKHKNFFVTKYEGSCEQSVNLAMAELEQQIKNWGKSLNAQGISPVAPFDNYQLKHIFHESGAVELNMGLTLDTQLYSQGTPYLPTPE